MFCGIYYKHTFNIKVNTHHAKYIINVKDGSQNIQNRFWYKRIVIVLTEYNLVILYLFQTWPL